MVVRKRGRFITLTNLDGNLRLLDLFPNVPYLVLHSIQYRAGSGSTDSCIILEGNDPTTAPEIFNSGIITTAGDAARVEFDGVPADPYFYYSGSTVSAGAKISIVLSEEPQPRVRMID